MNISWIDVNKELPENAEIVLAINLLTFPQHCCPVICTYYDVGDFSGFIYTNPNNLPTTSQQEWDLWDDFLEKREDKGTFTPTHWVSVGCFVQELILQWMEQTKSSKH